MTWTSLLSQIWAQPAPSLSTNQRPASRSCDQSGPIRARLNLKDSFTSAGHQWRQRQCQVSCKGTHCLGSARLPGLTQEIWIQPSQSPEYNTQIHTTSLLTPRRCIKERAKKTMTKPNCILSIYFWELSALSYSYSCHYPMRFVDKSENRGCSVTVLNSRTIYFALSFIHLLDSRSDLLSGATLTLPALDVIYAQ